MPGKIEKLILSNEFQYLQPYFYTNPFALRCELGAGEGEAFRASARRRANEIHDILMPGGADAIIFNYYICDYADSGEAWTESLGKREAAFDKELYIAQEYASLSFLFDNLIKYRHVQIKNLRLGDPEDEEAGVLRRSRIICYSDGKGFDEAKLIDMMIADCPFEIGLVSFENECILSVYDDRGCDVTFATRAKMRKFYERLKPYFLACDAEEMEKRFRGEKK